MRLISNYKKSGLLYVLFFMFFISQNMNAQFSTIGGFEGTLPSYWNMGKSTGATLEWATDQFRSMGRSLKITKTAATADSVYWISDNMVDIWSPKHLANVDIKLGAYIKTEGVNVNPANDDARWWISYTFWDSAGTLIGETQLPIDQTVASSIGWVADTNATGFVLPKDSWKTIIKFVAGKNATGTVWADDFIFTGRGGKWAGQDWNTAVGVPTGFYYWLPPIGGNDGRIEDGFENTMLTTEAAHSGKYSLKFDLPAGRRSQDAFVSTKRMMLDQESGGIKPGDNIRISVWIKAKNLVPDSAAKFLSTWSVGITPGFFAGNGNNLGYTPIGQQPDLQFSFPKVTEFDWKKFSIEMQVPNDPNALALEVRLHVYSRFVGTVYFDDLTVEKITSPTINMVGGFEGDLPSYWNKGKASGASLDWATDTSRSMGRSLKITKTATTPDSVYWISDNMVDIWSPKHLANVDMKLGAYVMTKDVNTNPANDDARWWISYTFWDSTGTLIGETKLPIDQTVASSTGWVADTNATGFVLPKDSWKTIIKFVAGKNATGTVWADDFMLVGRGGKWAGQDWNTAVGVPTGFYYWLPPIGGNDGRIEDGFENTKVTSEEYHSGKYSLKFDLPAGRRSQDAFVSTRRFLLANEADNIKSGDKIRISVWIKAKNLVPDSAAKNPSTWSVGFTPGFFAGNGNNLGYTPIGQQPDSMFVFPNVTQFDWTEFHNDLTVPTDTAAKAIEIRLHVYSRFVGTVYFDDLTISKLTSTGVNRESAVASKYELIQNYPNPFNPTTNIRYSIPENTFVTVRIFDVLGREVKTLVSTQQNAGVYNVTWEGTSNSGARVASGTYIYRIEAGSFIQSKKMILLK